MQCFSGCETSRVIGRRNVCVANVTALEPVRFVVIMIVTQGCGRSLRLIFKGVMSRYLLSF